MKIENVIAGVLLGVTVGLLIYGAVNNKCTRLPYGGSLNCPN